MTNKFDKLDKLWVAAYIMVDIVAILVAVIGVIFGIIAIVTGAELEESSIILQGVIWIIGTPMVAAVYWVMVKVFLSLCRDVKILKKTVCGEKTELSDGYSSRSSEGNMPQSEMGRISANMASSVTAEQAQSAENNKVKNFAEQLREVKQLFDDGILSQDEFDIEKQKILNSKN